MDISVHFVIYWPYRPTIQSRPTPCLA